MSIENWWIDLCKKHALDKWSGGFETIEECKKMLSTLDIESKNRIIDHLTELSINKGQYYSLAVNILTDYTNKNSIDKIYQKALTLKDNHKQDEYYYIDLLKVIASNETDDKLDLVRDFIFGSKFNSNQSFLQWSLWPSNKYLFCEAYSHYLEHESKWTQSAIVQVFMHNSEALSELKKFLTNNKKNKIWNTLKSDLEKELKKDLWDISSKNKIKEIL